MASRYKKVLVPIDGSEQANEALIEAAEIAKRYGAQLIVTTVVDDYLQITSPEQAQAIYEFTRKAGTEIVEKAIESIKDSELEKVEGHVLKGDPRHSIVDYAKEENVDLVVIGSTGKGAIERVLLGSVSEFVVRHSHCDVLVLRH